MWMLPEAMRTNVRKRKAGIQRQCLLRLPQTRAVVFTIHTYVVLAETLTPEELAALMAAQH